MPSHFHAPPLAHYFLFSFSTPMTHSPHNQCLSLAQISSRFRFSLGFPFLLFHLGFSSFRFSAFWENGGVRWRVFRFFWCKLNFHCFLRVYEVCFRVFLFLFFLNFYFITSIYFIKSSMSISHVYLVAEKIGGSFWMNFCRSSLSILLIHRCQFLMSEKIGGSFFSLFY